MRASLSRWRLESRLCPSGGSVHVSLRQSARAARNTQKPPAPKPKFSPAESSRSLSSSPRAKNKSFCGHPKSVASFSRSAPDEGRTRRHERGAECDGREGADGRAALSPPSPGLRRTGNSGAARRLAKDGSRTAKSCGPGAPMQAPSSRLMRLSHRADDGGNKLVHRGEYEVSRKPLAQGRPECLRRTCGQRPAHFFRAGAMGGAITRPSLRPPISDG